MFKCTPMGVNLESQNLYCIAGYFPKVQIFLGFLNGLTTWENLFWTLEG